MTIRMTARAALAGLAILAAGWGTAALADTKDDEFQVVEKTLQKGEATIAVKLVDKRTGSAVPDAVIFATRLDMAPDGMPTMTTKTKPAPSDQPDVYRFRTTLTMQGNRQRSLGAKVRGETGTLERKLVLETTP
jgi:hypothetical protein